METIIQLKIELEKIIYNLQEPKEISELFETIYIDYKNIIESYIERLTLISGDNVNLKNKIKEFGNYIIRGYNDDVSVSRDIRIAEFDFRKLDITKELFMTIDKSIILDTEVTKKENDDFKMKNIKDTVVSSKRNMKYQMEIKDNLISDLKTSRNAAVGRIKELKINSPEEKNATTQYIDEMNLLFNNATLKLHSIKEILDKQDEELFEQFVTIIEQYKEEITKIKKQKENKSEKDKRNKFKSELSRNGTVKIDEEKAIKITERKKLIHEHNLDMLDLDTEDNDKEEK